MEKLTTPPANDTVASAVLPEKKVTVQVGVGLFGTPATTAVNWIGVPTKLVLVEELSIRVGMLKPTT